MTLARQAKSGVEALQIAVLDRLKNDSGVLAVVQKSSIYDEPPSDKQDKPKPPYVYLGPVNRRRIEGGVCVDGKTVTFRVFVVSTEFGRTEAWEAIEAIERALNNKKLPVAGPWSTAGDTVKAIQDGDVVQPLDPKAAFIDFTVTLLRTGD